MPRLTEEDRETLTEADNFFTQYGPYSNMLGKATGLLNAQQAIISRLTASSDQGGGEPPVDREALAKWLFEQFASFPDHDEIEWEAASNDARNYWCGLAKECVGKALLSAFPSLGGKAMVTEEEILKCLRANYHASSAEEFERAKARAIIALLGRGKV